MKTIILFFFFSLFCAYQINAQVSIKGTITDSISGKPLAGVSVYVNNSAYGTTTNESGYFKLNIEDLQRFDMVISSIGYGTLTRQLTINSSKEPLNFKLLPISKELEAIVVKAYDNNDWIRWHKLFEDNFIGTGYGSDKCDILNPKALRFKYEKDKEELNVFSIEPVVIQNKYLGYQLSYDLESFQYDFKKHQVFFLGYPLFKEMEGSEKENAKWQQNRKYAYEGSVMHFMRALFSDKLEKEGFSLNAVTRQVNNDKSTTPVSRVLKNDVSMASLVDMSTNGTEALLKTDSIDLVSNEVLTRDTIAYVHDSATVIMDYLGHVQVKYAKAKEGGVMDLYRNAYVKGKPTSIITILNDLIIVYKNGTYYEPYNMLTEGYWSRSEKAFNLLPINYVE